MSRPCGAPFALACWLAACQWGEVSALFYASSERSESEHSALASSNDTMLEHIIVVPEHRLLFCAIDGVEAESFNHLFRSIRSNYDPSQKKGANLFRNAYWSHGFNEQELLHLFQDKTWYKAVFLREPIERFVAVFNSTCGSSDEDAKERCKAMFGAAPKSLPEAVNRFRSGMIFDPISVTNEKDSHLTQQVNYCGGLGKNIGMYNTVVQMKTNNMRDAVEKLLAQVGVPFQNTKHALNKWFPVDAVTGPNQSIRQAFPSEHAPWMLRTLLTRYARDYQTLNMPVPHWIDDSVVTQDGGSGLPLWVLAQRQKAAAAATAARSIYVDVNSTQEIDMFNATNESFIAAQDYSVDGEIIAGEVTAIQD